MKTAGALLCSGLVLALTAACVSRVFNSELSVSQLREKLLPPPARHGSLPSLDGFEKEKFSQSLPRRKASTPLNFNVETDTSLVPFGNGERMIVGKDNRQQSPAEDPYIAVAYLPDNACTGFAVGHNRVFVTARHCHIKGGERVYFGYGLANAPYHYFAEARIAGFYGASDNVGEDRNDDWVVAVLDRDPDAGYFGWVSYGDLSREEARHVPWFRAAIAGYGYRAPNGARVSDPVQYRDVDCVASATGKERYPMWVHSCDMLPGNSGGPVWNRETSAVLMINTQQYGNSSGQLTNEACQNYDDYVNCGNQGVPVGRFAPYLRAAIQHAKEGWGLKE